MSACKTGCGKEAPGWSHTCDGCVVLWQASDEAKRSELTPSGDYRRHDVAFVDFCTRLRAERQNRRSQ